MFLRNLSIKNKLIGIILLVSFFAIGSGFTFIILSDIKTFKEDMMDNTIINAKLISEYCITPMVFEDKAGAEEILKKLQAIPYILKGHIYDNQGILFASYNKMSNIKFPPPQEVSNNFIGNYLHVTQPIIYKGQEYGKIYLLASVDLLKNKINKYLFSVILLVITIMFLSYFLANKLQNVLSKPILNLADVTRKISDKGDYSIRVERKDRDEITVLYDGFNEMLKQIGARKAQIKKLNQELEQRVLERTAALETANDELKNFAYIVSHDLKAPLRGIGQLAHFLSDDYADVLGDEAKEMLVLLVGRVKRMHNLIDGILQYSRIGRIKDQKKRIDLNALVMNTIDIIAPPDNIYITIENSLPAVVFEKTRIEQVFQNLLSNAIKFIDKPVGEIKIKCVDEGPFWKFSIADNGPGIEEKYYEKIFHIFQTLKSRDEQENTGVGLSIVKKIIKSYAGEVWVESKMGEGSIFIFTLPKGV